MPQCYKVLDNDTRIRVNLPQSNGNTRIRQMTTMSATYDDGFLFVLWTAPGIPDDYGVPSSPRWYSPVDDEAEPHTVHVMGEPMDYNELPRYMRDAVDNTYSNLEWVVE